MCTRLHRRRRRQTDRPTDRQSRNSKRVNSARTSLCILEIGHCRDTLSLYFRLNETRLTLSFCFFLFCFGIVMHRTDGQTNKHISCAINFMRTRLMWKIWEMRRCRTHTHTHTRHASNLKNISNLGSRWSSTSNSLGQWFHGNSFIYLHIIHFSLQIDDAMA